MSVPTPDTPPAGSRRAELTEELDALLGEITSLETRHGSDTASWSQGVSHRVDSLRAAIASREADLTRLTEQAEKAEAVRRAYQNPSNREAVPVAGAGVGSPDPHPWDRAWPGRSPGRGEPPLGRHH